VSVIVTIFVVPAAYLLVHRNDEGPPPHAPGPEIEVAA
jgi:hypothetical protein